MTAARHLYSIQGEDQLSNDRRWVYATRDETDAYLASASKAVKKCRQRGHQWPVVDDDAGPNFVGVTPEGALVEQDDCECCGPLSYRERLWLPHRESGQTRWRPEEGASQVRYRTVDGISYQAPAGTGHITRRMVAEAQATKALRKHTPASVRKAAKARQRALDTQGAPR